MPHIAIIADDLTGAADSGARFAQVGLVTLVTLASSFPLPVAGYPPSNVLVVSTESRHLAPDQAVVQARLAAGRVEAECGVAWVYKKIDSTLRGHPGPELAAVMDALRLERALVAPAFPAQGRTTVNGRQWADGVPLEHTPFGHDTPVSDLLALFRDTAEGRPVQSVRLSVVRRGPAAVCEALNALGQALVIADAETDADLATIAQAAATCRVRLLCGSAGLARAVADTLPLVPAAPAPSLPPHPDGPALIVAGSRHPRTARQVEVARQRGMAVVQPDLASLDANDRTIETATCHLMGGRSLILTTAGLGDSPLDGATVAAQLAQVVRALAVRSLIGRLVLTGGDIAAAVCSALEATMLWLRGEVQPGIAWGVLLDGVLPGLPVVTKAGGFGSDDTFAHLL